jgi:hypothetical protein
LNTQTQPAMQLDIFNHSADVMRRNDVLDALERRDAAAAAAALRSLQAEFPGDAALAPMALLLQAITPAATLRGRELAQLTEDRRALMDDIVPAAVRLLGEASARRWVAPLWAELAQRAAALPYAAPHAPVHAAALWLQAGQPGAAADAVTTIDSWFRIPQPLAWMVAARHAGDGLDGTWPLLVELAWLAPARLEALLPELADPVLNRLRKDFDAGFEDDADGGGLAWFPAWVLTEKPALGRLLAQARPGQQTAPELAFRLLVELLGLERQGRRNEAIAHRKRLQALHGGLYGAYMKTR